jgi:adenylylsulfate kinase-like enzyme
MTAQSMIYWFTGQPGSGKTTLALALKGVLQRKGYPVVHFDGDDLREIMDNRDFSEAGRRKNITVAQNLAAKLHAEGIVVAASFVSPYRQLREDFKKKQPVIEIYVHTTELRGRENFFVPNYEPPEEDFVDIDTTDLSVDDCVRKILAAQRLPSSRYAQHAGGGRPRNRSRILLHTHRMDLDPVEHPDGL